MVIALFDTNILIDYLNGENLAKTQIEKYDQISISIITYIEIMAGVDRENKTIVEAFLNSFNVLNFDTTMAGEIANIRNTMKIKLPDAIILATARCNNAILITRDTKNFSKNDTNIIIPYKLEHKK